MGRRPRTLVLAVVVAGAALLPLFGDPRATPFTHPLWARLLLRALDMNEALGLSTHASQVFAALSWRDSLSLQADEFVRADGVVLRDHRVVAGATPGEVTYPLVVIQPGDYQFRAQIAGPAHTLAAAEISRLGGGPSLESFSLLTDERPAWVFAGSAHLDRGTYGAQFLLPPGGSLGRVEVAPPCIQAIEPPGGWQPKTVTTSDDVAVTVLQAIESEHQLPSAAPPVTLPPAAFQLEYPAAGTAATVLAARAEGLRAIASFEVGEAGLYGISALLDPGAGQRWLVDGCQKAIVCPGTMRAWRPVLTLRLAPGRHALDLALGVQAAVDLVRIERLRESAADYRITLGRLGFDPGPAGPVTRETALEAAAFVRERRASAAASCGDPIRQEETPRTLASASTRRAEGGTDQPQAAGSHGSPPLAGSAPDAAVEAPILPPQLPATPTRPSGS